MSKVVLYHATDNSSKDKILVNGFNIRKINWNYLYGNTYRKYLKQPGSLEYGIYGFYNDKNLAGNYWDSLQDSKNCSILKLEVDIDEDKCLNFVDDLNDMRAFREFLMNPKTQLIIGQLNNKYKNKITQHELDGALLEYFIQSNKDYICVDYVCCATTTNLYQTIHSYIPNGIEYCIRNKNSIYNVEEISLEED